MTKIQFELDGQQVEDMLLLHRIEAPAPAGRDAIEPQRRAAALELRV